MPSAAPVERLHPRRPLAPPVDAARRLLHLIRWLRVLAGGPARVTAAGRPMLGARCRFLGNITLTVGERVAFGRGVYSEVHLDIGDDVLVSGSVAFIGNLHPLDGAGTVFASRTPSDDDRVVLRGDNLIGHGSILIAPCIMEHGAVLGAGGVATGRLERDTIYGGVPARPIRRRDRT